MTDEMTKKLRELASDIRGVGETELTMPVQIDSIMRLEGFQRSRCIYFLLEVIAGPIVGPYTTSFDDRALLATWGNWAVLTGPGTAIAEGGLFISPEIINQTLQSIEDSQELILELSHIWLPNSLLRMEENDKEIRKGDVYRLSTRLFRDCYRFVSGLITEKEWL